eukprot:CAMPEP_0170554260 /NCGR_PEP_ID=MMETSP0211-20121228/12134_1 /TAXON_ID=311385 /ORGANISM="Pseudokeronopsis sp., Strain OXSARD2" /LENGTH=175 /DNA_ID=CAMNT_0010863205 /DNA_START=1106 /DNA_END=1630 /DNA_ORIENTATION=-
MAFLLAPVTDVAFSGDFAHGPEGVPIELLATLVVILLEGVTLLIILSIDIDLPHVVLGLLFVLIDNGGEVVVLFGGLDLLTLPVRGLPQLRLTLRLLLGRHLHLLNVGRVILELRSSVFHHFVLQERVFRNEVVVFELLHIVVMIQNNLELGVDVVLLSDELGDGDSELLVLVDL